jgi:hypothetical protein
MAASTAGICWPSRYLIKWLTIFLIAVVIGAILAVLTRRPPPTLQQYIIVSNSQGVPIRAKLYWASSQEEMKEARSFYVDSKKEGAISQSAGARVRFMVEPVGADNTPLGDPELWELRWPEKENETLRFEYKGSIREDSGSVTPSRTRTNRNPPTRNPGTDSRPGTNSQRGNITVASGDNYDWLSTRAVTEQDLQGKTKEQLRIMRNWLFARKGYIFSDARLQAYFSKQRWYRATTRSIQDSDFTEMERSNIAMIRDRENTL